MTFPDFEELQKELFADIEKMRDTKGKEYANSDDRLANFKRVAAEIGISPLQVGWTYFKKHYDSICSYLKNGQEFSEEGIRGRFIDAINYLTLIYGLIVDENEPDDYTHLDQTVNISPRSYIYRGGCPIYCKQCKQEIKKGEEYNVDPSGYNHYPVCPK